MRPEKAKEIAAELLGVGKNKVYINPEELDSVKEAMTRQDIRELIAQGIISKVKESEQSRARARKLEKQKKKGRRKGHGSRKGKKTARAKKKEKWVANVRAQRAYLRELKQKYPEEVKKIGYRRLYMMIKGGYFRSKAHLERFIKGA